MWRVMEHQDNNNGSNGFIREVGRYSTEREAVEVRDQLQHEYDDSLRDDDEGDFFIEFYLELLV
jgi:hypothetical protein